MESQSFGEDAQSATSFDGAMLSPPADVVASIRHGEPGAVPDELIPHVVPVHGDGRLDDWLLTSDVDTCGDVTVTRTFEIWRSSWERSWSIESQTHLERLVARAIVLNDSGVDVVAGILSPVLMAIDRGDAGVIGCHDVARLAAALETLRNTIAAAAVTGFGFVNATPGHTGSGLAGTWSRVAGPQVLAADGHLTVYAHPETGLGFDRDGQRIAAIREVCVHVDSVEVHHEDPVKGPGSLTLPYDRALPLSSIVPDATRWRVVEVPEVLVWARAFGALTECAEAATSLEQPVYFASQASFMVPGRTGT